MDARVYEIESRDTATARKVEAVEHVRQARAGPEQREVSVRRSVERQSQSQGESGRQSDSSDTLDRDKLERVIAETQERLNQESLDLKYTVNEDSGDIQVELVDSENEKVVRKIPSDELLKLHASLKELAGAFLNRSV